MKTITYMLAGIGCLFLVIVPVLAGNRELSDLEDELVGDWLAALPASNPQSVKTLCFSTNHVVTWTDVNTNSSRPHSGVWVPGTNSSARFLPSLVVAPTNYPDPFQVGNALLTLSNVRLDYDSRFHQQHFGKLLHALDGNGHPLLFIKIRGQSYK